MDRAALDAGVAALRSEGFDVVEASNVNLRRGYLAGDDDERARGVQELLDRGVSALVASRGGYGVMRILDRLPWERLAAWGGWVVGLSDLTALHAALSTRFPYATLHGPMVGSLGRRPEQAAELRRWLRGEAGGTVFEFGPAAVLAPGRVRGVSVGGNLAMLAALESTPYAPSYDGAVLFLEDVGEPLYRLDRLLTQLRLAARFANLRAVVVGRLEGCGRGEDDWLNRWRSLVMDAVSDGTVVVEGLPFGHGDDDNRPFPLGAEVSVDTWRGTIVIEGA